MCEVPLGAVENSVSGSVASRACIGPALAFGRERQTDFQWPSLPQFSHFVPYARHDLLDGLWNVPQLPHLPSWKPCAGGWMVGVGVPMSWMVAICFRASILLWSAGCLLPPCYAHRSVKSQGGVMFE